MASRRGFSCREIEDRLVEAFEGRTKSVSAAVAFDMPGIVDLACLKPRQTSPGRPARKKILVTANHKSEPDGQTGGLKTRNAVRLAKGKPNCNITVKAKVVIQASNTGLGHGC